MQLGCNSILFAGSDLKTAIESISWAGYKHIEFAAVKQMGEHVSPDLNSSQIQEIRQLLTDHGLQATAMEVASPDPARLEPLFGIATELGVGIVNIGSGGTTGDEESVKQAIENIGNLARLAGQHGLTLAVKPHVGQAIYDSATGMRLMDEVREPALGLNFDPSHLFRANENPEDVAKLWGSRIVTSHFRDCDSREQRVGPPETQIPGRGIVNLPATLRALVEVGYTGPLNLEVIGAKEYPLPRVMGIAAESRGYLNRCFQELGLTA